MSVISKAMTKQTAIAEVIGAEPPGGRPAAAPVAQYNLAVRPTVEHGPDAAASQTAEAARQSLTPAMALGALVLAAIALGFVVTRDVGISASPYARVITPADGPVGPAAVTVAQKEVQAASLALAELVPLTPGEATSTRREPGVTLEPRWTASGEQAPAVGRLIPIEYELIDEYDTAPVAPRSTSKPAQASAAIASDPQPRARPARRESRPAQSADASDFAPADYKLEGIIWSGKSPAAIVNDRIVEAGDKVGGALISSIKKNHIVISVGGVQHQLHL